MAKYKCAARNGSVGANQPQDCNWPVCGCDPVANKVLDTLDEMGYFNAGKAIVKKAAVAEASTEVYLGGRQAGRYAAHDGSFGFPSAGSENYAHYNGGWKSRYVGGGTSRVQKDQGLLDSKRKPD